MRRQLAILLAASSVLALASACGGDGASTFEPDSETSAHPLDQPEAEQIEPLTCRVFDTQADVALTFTGYLSFEDCADIAGKLSGGGDYWTTEYRAPPSWRGEREVICTLRSPDSSLSVVVEDTGNAYNGTAFCGDFAHKGWR